MRIYNYRLIKQTVEPFDFCRDEEAFSLFKIRVKHIISSKLHSYILSKFSKHSCEILEYVPAYRYNRICVVCIDRVQAN
jgi:hypothetical protein